MRFSKSLPYFWERTLFEGLIGWSGVGVFSKVGLFFSLGHEFLERI